MSDFMKRIMQELTQDNTQNQNAWETVDEFSIAIKQLLIADMDYLNPGFRFKEI